MTMRVIKTFALILAAGAALYVAPAGPASASSHMDAPLVSLDDSANTTDVYAFKSNSGGIDYLTTALAVSPFEEPGVGPNNYRFDPRADYEIHVSLGSTDIGKGKADITYRFEFRTTYVNPNTILQTYLGPLTPNGTQFPTNQNLRQTYLVTKIDHRAGNAQTILGGGLVPPNNQGRLTAAYNQAGSGDNPALEGVTSAADLDGFTKSGIRRLRNGYVSFAGQRDDGFYADVQSIFDLDFGFAKPAPSDTQGGSNVHTIVLNIPLSELGGVGTQIAGVYATVSRPGGPNGIQQVARQGNPLFNEALVANKDKDLYNATPPTVDTVRFKTYAQNPELAAALGSTPIIPGLIESIYIPDLIKVDLTTPAAKLAGQAGFNRLGVFGGDVLLSTFQDPFGNGGFIPGGWPNGRRFGDDVIDIAIIALGAAGPFGTDFSAVDIDKVNHNDITYNQVFPYAATPLNGRVHQHHN
jgi:Domain of unknown function (DUF4331)